MITISNQTVIAELKKLVEIKKEELQEAEQALRVVEKLLGQPQFQSVDLIKNGEIATSSKAINIADLRHEANSGRKTLRQEVTEVVEQFGAQEFTVAHIDSALKKYGVVVKGQSPRARISMTITKLEEEGRVRKTFVGKGNIPHRYKAVATELFRQ
ncbi:MAG: hypothetical protein CVU15_05480 [Betaproteobacteria bacterium HGW-Betaproteobacteria-1]|jgi:hypothetical protein|nr:MAG: hypothetical protein CVU15_05480 [Betaproteobacteria bacterium HGW-Betaproteobacteria-1]